MAICHLEETWSEWCFQAPLHFLMSASTHSALQKLFLASLAVIAGGKLSLAQLHSHKLDQCDAVSEVQRGTTLDNLLHLCICHRASLMAVSMITLMLSSHVAAVMPKVTFSTQQGSTPLLLNCPSWPIKKCTPPCSVELPFNLMLDGAIILNEQCSMVISLTELVLFWDYHRASWLMVIEHAGDSNVTQMATQTAKGCKDDS